MLSFLNFGLRLGFAAVFVLTFSSCVSVESNAKVGIVAEAETFNKDSKQKGAHVFGFETEEDLAVLEPYNLDWITLVPWGYQEDHQTPTVSHNNGDSLRMAKRDSSWVQRIRIAREGGYKVFLKPHIWMHTSADALWRSDIFPTSEANWELWKGSYRDFIMRYARLAEEAEAEMYCIGTELTRLAIEKPDFWKAIISEIRTVYSGKLIYAANWYKEYDKIEFWDQLDYIGVQAYFPLTKKSNPSASEISVGWDPYLSDLEAIHKKYGKGVVFTELGYKSTVDSAEEPWRWMEYTEEFAELYSLETQTSCYEAFFERVWEQEWLAGVHLWQMRPDHIPSKEKPNLDFTPQGKPAGQLIRDRFR